MGSVNFPRGKVVPITELGAENDEALATEHGPRPTNADPTQ
jgi:hypothetical protein